MQAQASRDDRRSVADFVIDNSGTLDDLVAEVDRCWTWMHGRTANQSQPSPGSPSRRPGETERTGERGLDELSGAENSNRLQTGLPAGLDELSGAEDSENQHD